MTPEELTPEEIQAKIAELGATHEEARAQISALAKLEGRDEQDLYDCKVEEVVLLVKVYHDAAAPKDRTPFANFLAVLGLCLQVAGPVAALSGALVAVFGVAGAAKALA